MEKKCPEEELMTFLVKDINKDRFLKSVGNACRYDKNCTEIKRVTTLRTIADAMNENDIYKKMLGEVDKALKIYMYMYITFPITTSTAERSFSSLCRLKTFFYAVQ